MRVPGLVDNPPAVVKRLLLGRRFAKVVEEVVQGVRGHENAGFPPDTVCVLLQRSYRLPIASRRPDGTRLGEYRMAGGPEVASGA